MTRRLRLAALASILLHAAVLAGSIGFLRRANAPEAKPDKPAMVELLMVEQKGAGPPAPGSPPPAAAPAQTAAATPPTARPPPSPVRSPAAEPQPMAEQQPHSTVAPQSEPAGKPQPGPTAEPQPSAAELLAVRQPEASSPSAAASAEALPTATPTEASPTEAAPTTAAPITAAHGATPPPVPSHPAPPPPTQTAPMEMNIAGTDGPSNAIASGDDIIPASVDQSVRNRPPIYPQEAARRGQQGTVVLLIHVSPAGLSFGSDVLQSSGVAALDRAAQDAVAAWHFLPAVKDGAPVPFDMPMRFVFEFN